MIYSKFKFVITIVIIKIKIFYHLEALKNYYSAPHVIIKILCLPGKYHVNVLINCVGIRSTNITMNLILPNTYNAMLSIHMLFHMCQQCANASIRSFYFHFGHFVRQQKQKKVYELYFFFQGNKGQNWKWKKIQSVFDKEG